jgi:phospholipid/cholesterol/gamma-HCH transport system substrate-binding protein
VRKMVLIAAGFVLALTVWFVVREGSTHRLTLHAYYRHVQNVKQGMPVCVDGVSVGSVTSVRVRPELGDRPVDVVLDLRTPYELKIPVGSTAEVVEPGILRPTVVDIDTRAAGGAPIANGGAIEGRESADDQAAHALGVAVKALVDQSKGSQDKAQKTNKPAGK